jgi:predicted ATP-binding protein involved in virulence
LHVRSLADFHIEQASRGVIKGVFVQNFMRIDQRVDIDLGPVTVLVGANGSGKSSILKAVHWAVRCATLKDHNNNTTIEQMDYTPSRDFLQLGHKKRIQNSEAMPKICVGFVDDNDDETVIHISAARNDAGAKAPISGPLSSVLMIFTGCR